MLDAPLMVTPGYSVHDAGSGEYRELVANGSGWPCHGDPRDSEWSARGPEPLAIRHDLARRGVVIEQLTMGHEVIGGVIDQLLLRGCKGSVSVREVEEGDVIAHSGLVPPVAGSRVVVERRIGDAIIVRLCREAAESLVEFKRMSKLVQQIAGNLVSRQRSEAEGNESVEQRFHGKAARRIIAG